MKKCYVYQMQYNIRNKNTEAAAFLVSLTAVYIEFNNAHLLS